VPLPLSPTYIIQKYSNPSIGVDSGLPFLATLKSLDRSPREARCDMRDYSNGTPVPLSVSERWDAMRGITREKKTDPTPSASEPRGEQGLDLLGAGLPPEGVPTK